MTSAGGGGDREGHADTETEEPYEGNFLCFYFFNELKRYTEWIAHFPKSFAVLVISFVTEIKW